MLNSPRKLIGPRSGPVANVLSQYSKIWVRI